MKENYRRVPTRFAPEIRFEVTPAPPAPFGALQESALEQLKRRLLYERLRELADVQLNCQLRRAANEAADLAWGTCYPLLIFPALFQEKAESALTLATPRESVSPHGLELQPA